MSFSVITSVYRNDKPEYVISAFDSISKMQSAKPDEIVVVVDGPIPAPLENVIKQYENKKLFNIIWLPENKGLGNALKIGVEASSNNIIARMDSDDISLPDRFEKQLSYLEKHKDCDVIGGQMTEFIDNPENIVARREVPISNESIYKYMKSRCAMNHVTVMFRKEAVLKVGNYQDWFWNEDYFLWVRMMNAGSVFSNLPDVLVNVRSGADQYARRGGKKYFHSEAGIQKYMLDHNIISYPRFLFNTSIRYVVQVIMPNSVRGFVFQKLFRK